MYFWGNIGNTDTASDPLWFLQDPPATTEPQGDGPSTITPPTGTQLPADTVTPPESNHVVIPGQPQEMTPEVTPEKPQETTPDTPGNEAEVKPTPVEPSDKPTAMFALIIGINKYTDQGPDPLKGAVADADDVSELLVSTLRVPKEHIVNLRNEEATRSRIENAIRALGEDARIQKHDPILIFYAGHGSEVPAPTGWPGEGQIQMILPHNFVKTGTSDLEGQGILDIQLSRLLSGVAEKKSNNITVILDSCHSGSGTRTSEKTAFRGVELPKNYTISQALLNEVAPSTRASAVAKGYNKKGLASHVLLAACKDSQKAQEEFGRGVFSLALMKLFRDGNLDKITYADVIDKLPVLRRPDQSPQNPQCEGINQHRVLFDNKVPSLRRQTYQIGATTKANRYKLYAGEAQGVMPNAEFAVYTDKDLTGNPLGHVKGGKPTAFSTTCSIIPATQEPFKISGKFAYAVQTKAGAASDVRLFLDLGAEHKEIFEHVREEILSMDAGKRGVEFVKHLGDTPDLVVTASGNFARFEIKNSVCVDNDMKYMPFDKVPIERDSIFRILRSAADFYFHLRRSATSGPALPISLKCHKLAPSGKFDSETLSEILLPEEHGTDLNVGGTIKLSASHKKIYGFEVVNGHKKTPFYIGVFYFDMSDLSIDYYYLPNTAQSDGTIASIPANGSLAIGYGSSGTRPRKFFVREGQNVDVGFVRLFVSTEFVDLSHIEQRSPFIESRASNEGAVRLAAVWNGISVPIVITKSTEEEAEDDESDAESI